MESIDGLPPELRDVIKSMVPDGAEAVLPDGMTAAVQEAMESGDVAGLLPVRVRCRLVEAGIEIDLAAEGMKASVLVDPEEFTHNTSAALSNLSFLVHQALVNYMTQAMEGANETG